MGSNPSYLLKSFLPYQKSLHQKSDMRLKAGTSALAETESKSKVWLSKFDIAGSDKIHACFLIQIVNL